MANSGKPLQPIIIKRVKKGGHAAHGGAWKIAYADFVTAMMAFFLLMWLMGSTTKEEKQAIADFFQNPSPIAGPGGASTSMIKVGGGKDVTSLLVSLGDEAASHSGALLKMLMPLAERGINLSKIESRPSKKRPWDYYFFLDVTGHYDDANMKAAVGELKKFCPLVKWLGSYPAVS